MVAFLFLLPLLSSCETIHAWDRGYPEKGDSLEKFSLVEFKHDLVVLKDGDDEKKYARQTFMPILRRIAPEAEESIRLGDEEHAKSSFILPLYIQGSTYTISDTWPEWISRARDVVMVGTVGLAWYFGKEAEKRYQHAADTYNAALAKSLGGK